MTRRTCSMSRTTTTDVLAIQCCGGLAASLPLRRRRGMVQGRRGTDCASKRTWVRAGPGRPRRGQRARRPRTLSMGRETHGRGPHSGRGQEDLERRCTAAGRRSRDGPGAAASRALGSALRGLRLRGTVGLRAGAATVRQATASGRQLGRAQPLTTAAAAATVPRAGRRDARPGHRRGRGGPDRQDVRRRRAGTAAVRRPPR